MKVYLTLLFIITSCVFMKGYIGREISKKRYNRACKVVYLPEKQRIDDTIIRLQETDEIDRNFRNPLDDQFKESEITKIIADRTTEHLSILLWQLRVYFAE